MLSMNRTRIVLVTGPVVVLSVLWAVAVARIFASDCPHQYPTQCACPVGNYPTCSSNGTTTLLCTGSSDPNMPVNTGYNLSNGNFTSGIGSPNTYVQDGVTADQVLCYTENYCKVETDDEGNQSCQATGAQKGSSIFRIPKIQHQC